MHSINLELCAAIVQTYHAHTQHREKRKQTHFNKINSHKQTHTKHVIGNFFPRRLSLF